MIGFKLIHINKTALQESHLKMADEISRNVALWVLTLNVQGPSYLG